MPAVNPRPLAVRLLVLLAALGLAACKSPSLPVVYRIDVQQGNVVTQDMLDQLEPGMDKRKVRFVLGTPLVQDSFNPDRWDYYYSFQDRRKQRSSRRVTLWFEQNQLVKIDGHVLRAEQRRIPEPTPEQVVVVPERQDPGIFAILTPPFLKRDKREESLERSRPELDEAAAKERAENEPLAAADPAGEVAPAAPATGGASAEQVRDETRYFQQLFQGYGRESDLAESLVPDAPQAPDQAPAQPAVESAAVPAEVAPTATEAAGVETTGGETGAAPEASEEEKGFFSRMVERMRQERGNESAAAAEQPVDAPSAPTEGIGEED